MTRHVTRKSGQTRVFVEGLVPELRQTLVVLLGDDKLGHEDLTVRRHPTVRGAYHVVAQLPAEQSKSLHEKLSNLEWGYSYYQRSLGLITTAILASEG